MPELSSSHIAESEKTPDSLEVFKRNVESLVESAQGKIVITGHIKPDDDAFCSAVAYKRILQNQYPEKSIAVVFTNRAIDAWNNFLTSPDEVTWAKDERGKTEDGKIRMGDVVDYLKEGDVLICLDGGTYDRFSRESRSIAENKDIKKAILDHHPGKPSEADTAYSEPESSSTCELLANMYESDDLPQEVYELLLAGILDDTQHLKTVGEQSKTRILAEKLREKTGKTFAEIEQKISKSEQEKIYFEAFRNHVTKFNKPNTPTQTYSYLTFKELLPTVKTRNAEYDQFIARREFMQELVQTGESDLYWTAVPYKKLPDGSFSHYGVSFRRGPTSDIDLNELAGMYGGGGHVAAAAGNFEISTKQQAIIKEKKNADKQFDEAAYICELIAEDIANKLTSSENKTETEAEESQDPPIEQIQQQLKDEAEKHIPSEETATDSTLPVEKKKNKFLKLFHRIAKFLKSRLRRR